MARRFLTRTLVLVSQILVRPRRKILSRGLVRMCVAHPQRSRSKDYKNENIRWRWTIVCVIGNCSIWRLPSVPAWSFFNYPSHRRRVMGLMIKWRPRFVFLYDEDRPVGTGPMLNVQWRLSLLWQVTTAVRYLREGWNRTWIMRIGGRELPSNEH
jgi:hypothetical protein